ncbi:response regulator [Caldinitratiruptor microaerophilus]|uniref:Stage 0 sporulation protein A homolog n=1 Tax=Caldinitratiruptor microaerophilus TaxID=671077 RepID=A0AA35CMT2_9FIRM|nr:response regulator [Caldinitratiruptor microaerophilus]BDG61359.1 hypothetical protein caldi_24490 [Caldinitratiruptor microaerophilus]
MDYAQVLAAVYRDSLDGIVITDAATVIRDCNAAYAELTGFSREELIGRRVNVVRSGLTPPETFREMWQALNTQGRWVGELINRRKDGSLWISFLSITRVLDEKGNVSAYVGISRDLTERRQLEERLREQSTRLDALLESIVAGTLMFDVYGRCVVANRRISEILGVGREALLGQPRSRIEERLRGLFADPDVLRPATPAGERTIATREARPRYFVEFWAPVRTASGAELGQLFTYRDVTREVEVDRMKSEFIATVSHELRTPMTSIKGALGLLLGGAAGPVPEAQRELLTIARNNTDRLIRLINDILDLSKIDAGRMELRPRPLSVEKVVTATLQELEGFRQQRQIEVRTDLPPGLPPIQADPDRIEQVLVNLVGNALKFTDPGGRVEVRAREEGDHVRIEVADTGPGIPPERQPHIFERFSPTDGATRARGTGLGLAIAKALVEQHGGRIGFETEVGRGTTFFFTIPRAGAPATPTAVSPPPEAPAASPAPGAAPGEAEAASPAYRPRRPTVVVCDDDPDIVRFLSLALEQAGFRTLPTTRGSEVLQLCKRERVDCVTLDLLMPEMHGLEVARRLKEDPETRNIPIVVVSAYADQHQAELACLGVAGVVTKPVEPARLLAQVAATLGTRALHDGPPDILAVDDDPEMRRVVELILTGAGYRVRTAADGREALAAIAERLPDVLVLDLLMPNLDGFRLVRILQSDPRTARIPLLVLTAVDLTRGERSLLELGPTHHLLKGPRLQEEVVKRVVDLLGHRAAPDPPSPAAG